MSCDYLEHMGRLRLDARTLGALAKVGIHATDYTSGGSMARSIERLVAREFGYTLNTDPYGYFDLTKGGKFYELRLRHNGKPLYVSPSSNRGAGRCFKQKDLDNVFDIIDGFIIVDTAEFPEFNIYMLPVDRARDLNARNWLSGGKLNCTDFTTLAAVAKNKL